MPTTLPDRAARNRHRRRRLIAEYAAVVVAAFYLLLLAWNLSALEANFSTPFRPAPDQGGFNAEYNRMEPSHGTPAGPHWHGWLAQR